MKAYVKIASPIRLYGINMNWIQRPKYTFTSQNLYIDTNMTWSQRLMRAGKSRYNEVGFGEVTLITRVPSRHRPKSDLCASLWLHGPFITRLAETRFQLLWTIKKNIGNHSHYNKQFHCSSSVQHVIGA